MKTLIITVTIIALSAVIASIIVGESVYDGVVVEKPYEEGLLWDQKQKEADCAIETGLCIKTIEAGNIRIEFDISPKPVRSMSELVFSITVMEGAAPVTDAVVSIDLTMPGMFMGVHRPLLKHVSSGKYQGHGVIPACSHGGKLWKAEVTVEQKGKVATVSYFFEVKN